jgi:phosphoglycerol transferase MdoB-like AlkP superfamily enzyme
MTLRRKKFPAIIQKSQLRRTAQKGAPMHLYTIESVRGHKRLRLHAGLTVFLVFAASVLIALVCLWLQPGSLREALQIFWQQPRLIFLNWFPALVFTAVLYFLIGNVFYGSAISGGIMAVLSYINLLKIEGREDPLIPSDIGLFREALNAAGEYQLYMHWDKVAAIALLVACAVVLGIFIKTPAPKLRWRLLSAALSVAVFIGAVHFVYRDTDLYNSFTVPYAYNIPSVFNTLGFNYCFLYNYNMYPIDKLDGFSKSEVEDWIEESADTSPAVTPNVIMIMCEAFSDLADEPMFAYDDETDPLAAFHQVADSDRAISGHIVVSNYGAGTANTEFDVLTGMQTNMIGVGTTSAFRVVRKETKSVASLLAADGYNTFFMHPGQSWFYNRTSVYQRLGISDQVFIEAFDESDYKGTMISDAAFLDELEADLQTRLIESDAPLFTYAVTIQNHQSYGYSKYGFEPDEVPLTVSVSDSSMESLSVYMEGIRDSSEMLLQLTEYLDTIDEPTVLVFFGDHRPNVGTACTELGLTYNQNATPEETVDTYATPYVIWSNEAYAEAIDLQAAYDALSLPENGYLSDNYLGAVVMQLIGRSGQDSYMDFLNELRLTLPVVRVRESTYCLADGTFTDTLTDEQAALVDKLAKWTYYQLKY